MALKWMVPNNSQRRKSSSPALGAQTKRRELQGAQDARDNLSWSFPPKKGLSLHSCIRGSRLIRNQVTGQSERRSLLACPVLKSEPATWFAKPEIFTSAAAASRIRKVKLLKDRSLPTGMASVLGSGRGSGGLSSQLKCKSKRRRRRRSKRKGKKLSVSAPVPAATLACVSPRPF